MYFWCILGVSWVKTTSLSGHHSRFGTYYLKFHTQTDGLSTEYEGRFTEAAGIVMLRMMARGLNMMDRADSVHGLHRPAARVAHPPTAVDYTGQFSMEES